MTDDRAPADDHAPADLPADDHAPADLPADDHAPAADLPADPTVDPTVRPRGAWARAWRAWYRLLRVAGRPFLGIAVGRGYGNLVVLRTVGRRTRLERSTVLGVLDVGGRRYLGHPNGDAAWTLNLRAAATATIEAGGLPSWEFRPVPLGPGAERDAVVRATTRQHPFPGNALYRLAGRHVAAYGVFFRLEPAGPQGGGRDTDGDPAEPIGEASSPSPAGGTS